MWTLVQPSLSRLPPKRLLSKLAHPLFLLLYDLSSFALQGKGSLALLFTQVLFSPELDLKSDPSCLLTGLQASERPLA